jgi:hypothetical protein
MDKITSVTELRQAIVGLESQRKLQGEALNQQFNSALEILRPENLLNRAVQSMLPSGDLAGEIIGTSVGLLSGLITGKLVTGSGKNIFRRLFGTIAQVVVTTLVAKNSEWIKSWGSYIIHYFFGKKEHDSEGSDLT